MCLVHGLALELQFLDRIEGDDVVGIGGGDTWDVTITHRLHPAFDQFTDFAFGLSIHEGLSEVLVAPVLGAFNTGRTREREIDNREEKD